jgi:hypothetical protein
VTENLSHLQIAGKGKSMRIRTALLVFLFMVTAAPWTAGASAYELVEAGNTAGKGRIGLAPYAGVIFYGRISPQENTGYLEDLYRPSSFLVGVRLSRPLTRWLAVEATLSKSTTENVHQLLYVDPNPVGDNPPFGSQTLRNTIDPVLRLNGSLLLAVPVGGPITPHISVGLGWIHHSLSRHVSAAITVPLDDGTVFADTIEVPSANLKIADQQGITADMGAGLTGSLSDVLAVRLDAVLHLSRFSPLDVEGPLTGDVFYAASQWVKDFEVSTGLVFSVPANRFTGGPLVGLSTVRLRGDDVRTTGSNTAAIAGVSANYPLNGFVSIEPDLLFSRRRVTGYYQTTRLIAGSGETENVDVNYHVDLDYLEIPILAKLNLPGFLRVQPHLLAGPSLNLSLGGGYRVDVETQKSSRESGFHRSAGIGWVVGAGMDLGLGPGALGFGARYMLGATTVDNSPSDFSGPFDVRYRALSFLFGYSL